MTTPAISKLTFAGSQRRALLMIGLALVLAWAADHAYHLAQSNPFLRIDSLVAGIVSTVGIAACLGGAMHYLDSALATKPRWHWSILVAAEKRALMIGQIVAMALAVMAAGLMIFHAPIPGA
jgi:hypothetical protein